MTAKKLTPKIQVKKSLATAKKAISQIKSVLVHSRHKEPHKFLESLEKSKNALLKKAKEPLMKNAVNNIFTNIPKRPLEKIKNHVIKRIDDSDKYT